MSIDYRGPATAFLPCSPLKQFNHVLSENIEEYDAFKKIVSAIEQGKSEEDIKPMLESLIEEIIDGQIVRETMLYSLGLTSIEIQRFRKKVYEKNDRRGYYVKN